MKTVLLWLHLIGVTFWVGGTFVNALALLPSLQVIRPAERGRLMGTFMPRFARLTWVAIALIGVTGLILTSRMIPVSALLSTRYGNILVAKMVLMTVMAFNGGYVAFLGSRVASLAAPPGAAEPAGAGEGQRTAGPPPELVGVQGRMNILSWVQVVLALALLLLMGLL